MILSDAQMAVVTGPKVKILENVALPLGKQLLPAWVRGAYIEWMNGVANAPEIRLKVRGDAMQWPDKRFAKEGKQAYVARHADGRAEMYLHAGQVSMVELCDDRLVGSMPYAELPKISVRATTQQDGFGGRNFWLTMNDGEPLVLRGPWHGGAPPGYVEVHTVDMESAYNQENKWNKARPWYLRSATFGTFITEELFLRIVATYCPHVHIARVQHTYGMRLEPYRPEWDSLKYDVYLAELEKMRKHLPAGPFWRVCWDGTGRYCGSLRVPKYGYEDGVLDRVYKTEAA